MVRSTVRHTVFSWIAGLVPVAAAGILLASSPRVAVAQDMIPAFTPAAAVSERPATSTAATERSTVHAAQQASQERQTLHAAEQATQESQTLQNQTPHHAGDEEYRAENGD